MAETDFDKRIDEALKLRETGNLKDSIAILLRIFHLIPDEDVKPLVVTGSLLREANLLEYTLMCFEKAVKADPVSPRASLGLFHTRWKIGRYDDGFDELDRFLSLSESGEHSRLLKEMRKSLVE